MRNIIAFALISFACFSSSPAAAATRNFGVSGFDRVRVDGPYRVRLTTGVAPFASASGSQAALDSVAMTVQGRTLVVRADRASWGGYPGASSGPVEISIGTHDLTAAWLNGSGTLAIDQVRGLSFELSVQGSGLASIGAVAVDQFKLSIAGSGNARLAGSALKLTAVVLGVSGLDAAGLAVKDAVIGADGPATVRASVSGTAKINAQGASTVELAGSPACTVRAVGSASVTGCR